VRKNLEGVKSSLKTWWVEIAVTQDFLRVVLGVAAPPKLWLQSQRFIVSTAAWAYPSVW
jgi:hypothetical protein